jgi:hypothetical protein
LAHDVLDGFDDGGNIGHVVMGRCQIDLAAQDFLFLGNKFVFGQNAFDL